MKIFLRLGWTKLSLACLSSLAVALSVPVLAAASNGDPLSFGYYVGPGDGATDVLHVLPGAKKATLGGIVPFVQNKNLSQAEIRKAASLNQGAYLGVISEAGNGYILTLKSGYPKGSPFYIPTCRYSITPVSGGWHIQSEDMTCVHYHGASWGFGEPLNSMFLKKYKNNR